LWVRLGRCSAAAIVSLSINAVVSILTHTLVVRVLTFRIAGKRDQEHRSGHHLPVM